MLLSNLCGAFTTSHTQPLVTPRAAPFGTEFEYILLTDLPLYNNRMDSYRDAEEIENIKIVDILSLFTLGGGVFRHTSSAIDPTIKKRVHKIMNEGSRHGSITIPPEGSE